MRTRIVALALPLVVVAAGAAPAVAAKKVPAKTVNIGVIEMLSGGSAFYGNAVLEGINVAVDEINKSGGILGNKVTLTVKDNASDNAQSTTLMKAFAADKKMAVAIPPTYQPNFNAACAVADAAGLPIVSAQSGPPDPKNNVKGHCFTMTTDPVPQVAATFDYMASKKGVKKFTMVYDQDNGYVAFQRPNIAAAIKGKYELVEIGVAKGTTDYGPQITKVLEGNPDAVFPFLSPEDAARFMQQAKAKGFGKLWFDPVSQLTTRRMSELSGGAANGMIASTPQSAGEIPAFQKFLDLYKGKNGKDLDDPTYTGFGYDAMKMIAKAMTDAKTTTDRKKILAKLKSYQKACFSICFTPGTGGNAGAFLAGDFYFVKLTDKGFAPDK